MTSKGNDRSKAPKHADVVSQLLDALLVDIGGTLVVERPPGTAVETLSPQLLPDVLSDLVVLSRSVRIGAATNTSVMVEAAVRSLLATVGIDQYLDVVVTSCDVGAAKPDPAILLVAMDRLGLTDPSRILYVGDRDIDREAAVAAGMHFAPIAGAGLLASVLSWATERRRQEGTRHR